MPQPRTKIPPTGTTTLYLDWGALLARLPDTPTLASVAWTVPAGITEDASSNSAQSAQITISTSGLTIGTSYDLLCVATLSNANVQTATLPVYVSPLGIEPVALPPALSLIVPGGGGGGAVDSVNGATGTVVLTTSNIAEGTNLYYTDARFEAALGAAIATDFSAAIQTSLGLANTALQPGANISTLTNDAGFTTFDGAYSNLSGIPTTLTQLSGLAVANGQVIGWSGGVLANVAIGGGGDMLKSVYDSNDDGVLNVGAIPDLSGSYETAGAVAAHVALLDPHTQYAETADLGTAAFQAATAFATSAQGTLADTATQPGDNLSTLTNDSGFIAATNLAYTAAPTNGTVTSDAGTDATISAANVTNAGLLLPGEKSLIASAVQPAAISDFETTTQLNDRDTANRDPDNFSIIADLKTFLNAANTAAARDAIGVIVRQAPIIGTTRTSVALSTTKADSTLEAAITLTNASGRVLIWVAQSWELPVDGNSGLGLYLNRGATEILDPNPVDGTGPFLIYKFIAASGFNGTAQLMHIDTPGSIGPHTYKSRARSYNANGAELQPAGATQNALSTILLIEVA